MKKGLLLINGLLFVITVGVLFSNATPKQQQFQPVVDNETLREIVIEEMSYNTNWYAQFFPRTIVTNVPALNEWRTNASTVRFLNISVSVNLGTALASSAGIRLEVEKAGVFTNNCPMLIPALALGTEQRSISKSIAPGARFRFVNISTGTGTASLVANSYSETY